jgi:2'-5' RNA ligase
MAQYWSVTIARATSAVVVPVPAVEPVVSRWRERFDPSAAHGMPAHVTTLYPFLAEHRLTSEVVTELAQLCSGMPALEVHFRRAARFPDVLYLDPEPADDLRALTLAIAARWPEARPYGGAFDEVIPHLTVATGLRGAGLDAIEADLRNELPVSTRLAEARLYIFDGEFWRVHARLPFRD